MVLIVVNVNPVEIPTLLIFLYRIVVKSLFNKRAERCFISYSVYNNYFRYNKLNVSNLMVQFAKYSICVNRGIIELYIEICTVKTV